MAHSAIILRATKVSEASPPKPFVDPAVILPEWIKVYPGWGGLT